MPGAPAASWARFARAAFGTAVATLLVAGALQREAASAEVAARDAPPPARQAQLSDLVRHDCGSCHGLTLKGGLGPALTRDALAEQPVENLVATILHGRPGTPMPPWSRFLTEPEARWIAEALKKGMPHGR
jgi:cytochrome c55X